MLSSVLVSMVLLYVTRGAVVDNQKKVCRGVGEERRECGPACQPTCDQLGEKLCCEVRFVPGCFCADSYIRDHNGKCVAIADCPGPGVLTFDQEEATVLEGAKEAPVLVARVNGSRGRITVRWRVVITPTAGSYSGLSGVLEFEEGETQQSINIQLSDNDARNPDVVITLELLEPSEKTSIDRERMRLVIKDDDMRPGYPEMAEVGVFVLESHGEAVIQVLRVGGSDGNLSVQWRVEDVTANVDVDFLSPTSTGHLSFEEGETEKEIRVQIVDDEVREGMEDFRVVLFEPEAGPGVLNFRARGTRMTTTVHIQDDDMSPGYPEMDRKEVSVTESKGRVSITVVRRGGVDGEITVKWRIVPGTAVPVLDYHLPFPEEGLLSFAENETKQTISIRLVNDEVKEKKEKFRVEIFDPKPGPGVMKFRARGSLVATDVIINDDDMTPGVLELERSSYVVAETVEAFHVLVVRNGGVDGEVRVRWRTTPDGAAPSKMRAEPGRDFVAGDGELVFKDGEKKKFVLVHIKDDDIREEEESFVVKLYDARPGAGTNGFKGLGEVRETTIIIRDDDMRPGLLQLELSVLSVSEAAGAVQIAVVRTDGADGEVRVHWKAAAGARSDFFVPASGKLVFHDGEAKKDIFVKVVDNQDRDRDDRRFEVQLFDPTAGHGVINFKGLGETTKAVVTIQDDDMNPGRLLLDEPVYELVNGTVPLVKIIILREEGTDGRLRCRWKTTFRQEELEFEDGETRKEVVLPIGPDRSNFEFALLDVSTDIKPINFRTLLGEKKTALVRLSANPGLLNLEFPSLSVTERPQFVRLRVVRLNGTDGRVRAHWQTVPITATEGSDFMASGGALVFEEGVQQLFIDVLILDDKVRENSEQFAVELFGATTDGPGIINFRGGGLAETRRTIVTINDDDMKPGSLKLELPHLSVSEGAGSVKVGVVRTQGTDGRVRAHWRTVPMTATQGSDFVASEGELIFEEGVRLLFIEVQIMDDPVRENSEEFAVDLIGATIDGFINFRGLLEEPSRTTVTINDDDSHAGTFGFGDTHVTVSERAGRVILRVVRRDGTDGPVKLHWRPIAGTARDGLDFLSLDRGELNFEDGEREQSFSIDILNREGRNGERTFTVGIFDPSGGASLEKDSLLTIVIQDEEEPTRVFFRNSTLQVPRGSAEASFTVERSGGDLSRPITVFFETLEGAGTAREDVDFRRTKGPVTFVSDAFALRVRVTLLQKGDDASRRGTTPFFVVRISNPSDGEVVKGRDVLVVFITEVPQVQDDRKATTKDEGTTGQTQLEFRGIPPIKETVVTTCPAGMMLNNCAPGCQDTCPGLEPVCQRLGESCVKGCFCPPGMLLDHSLTQCVTPSQCATFPGRGSGVGNFGGLSTGFQVKVERQETRGQVEVRGGGGPPQQSGGGSCPLGMTFKECAPACQRTCPGLEPVCQHNPAGKCFKGCFCSSEMVLDHSLVRCVSPSRCVTGGQQERNTAGLLGGLLGR